MRPDRLEARLSIFDKAKTEKVLEAAFLQWIAFHVEEDVAVVRSRQAVKAAPLFGIERQDLDARFTGLPALQLQRCLRSQLV